MIQLTEMRKTTESQEQMSLFQWARMSTGLYPELKLLFHVPNEGKRTRYSGGKLLAEGLRPGVPDVCLPVPNRKYHGLFIEMKVGRNKPTDNQQFWLSSLAEQGYCTDVAYGWLDAKTIIENYLKDR